MGEGSESIAVLYLDDDRDGRELVTTRLEAEAECLTVSTEATVAAALDRFEDGDLDCIVSDYHLEHSNGVAFLEAVRAESSEFPFIMLTRTGSEETASEAISAGVTDYVVKGLADNQYELLADKIVDTVEHRRVEQVAAQTERLLHELTEQTNDVMWMFAADWSETLFVNSAYEDIFGQSTDRLEESPTVFLETVHPDDQDTLNRAMERVAGGESVEVSYRIEPTPDEIRWVESHGEPVRRDGEITRVAGFSRDITDRRQAKEELEERNEELDMFTSVVAHDLRGPLNIANGYLDLLEGKADAEAVQSIDRSLDRMERLITDLLTLARQGEVTDDTQRVALERLAHNYWPDAAGDDATLTVAETAMFECDPKRLGQALENLYQNAIEHSDGQVTVGRLDGAAGFYIEDDGPGIPEAQREELLATGLDTTGQTGRLSLGIPIVKRIVEAHGWSIEITDGTDGGARFEISGIESMEPRSEGR
jgi:PAS domain S-box-containing protein